LVQSGFFSYKKWCCGSVVMFMDDTVYDVRKYVYLVKMENFYDWKLGVVGRGNAAVYHFTITYYANKGIRLREDLRQDQISSNIIEYLNIELDEILHDDIRCYDDVTKTLYSVKLVEEFKKQFHLRNDSMNNEYSFHSSNNE
jgi:ABC-type multidrug transport system fused ATPase/permease subunit